MASSGETIISYAEMMITICCVFVSMEQPNGEILEGLAVVSHA